MSNIIRRNTSRADNSVVTRIRREEYDILLLESSSSSVMMKENNFVANMML